MPTLGVGDGKHYNDDIRRSQIRWIQRKQEWQDLFVTIDKLVAQANIDFFRVEYNYLPIIQFTEYDYAYQGTFARHQDCFLTVHSEHQRKLSFSIQLSDPDSYEGGDLEFTDVGIVPKAQNMRQQGTVIIFPSIIFHQVTPVTKGMRYSLVGWYEGTPWR
jgi:PKHD-type hydroxylase